MLGNDLFLFGMMTQHLSQCPQPL